MILGGPVRGPVQRRAGRLERFRYPVRVVNLIATPLSIS